MRDGTAASAVPFSALSVRDFAGLEGSDTLLNISTLSLANALLEVRGAQQNRQVNLDAGRFEDVLFQNTATGSVVWRGAVAEDDLWGLALGALPTGWQAIGAGDFSADGRGDLLVYDTNQSIIYMVDVASGAPQWTQITQLTSDYSVIGAGDFTGDAVPDVLVRNTATGATLFADVNVGAAFGGWTQATDAIGSVWRTVAIADITGDGRSDVIVQNTQDGSTLFRDVAAGAWGLIAGANGADLAAVGAGDVNGDGFADVIFQSTTSGAVFFADMAGGAFSGWGTVSGGLLGWRVAGVRDVDNDGFADVILQNSANGDVVFADMGPAGFGGFGLVAGGLGGDWIAI